MKYTELNVSFEKPDIWKKPSVKKLIGKGRPYIDFAKEIFEFEKLKESGSSGI